MKNPSLIQSRHIDQICDDLSHKGWSVTPDFLSEPLLNHYASEINQLHQQGLFKKAGIGSGVQHTIREQIRSDHILWLDPDTGTELGSYLAVIEELRIALNRQLFLNLVDFEGHAAIYPPGSCYQKHLDQFHNDDLRTITTILYLNDNWEKSHGGELLIYTNESQSEYIELLPHLGYLVTFVSSRYIHEVKPAKRNRLSITGWYKRRPVVMQN